MVSLIALSQLICVFVNKAKFAGILGLLFVLGFGAVGVSFSSSVNIFYNYLTYNKIAATVGDNVSSSLKLFLCIFSPAGFAIGNGIVFNLEDHHMGLNSHEYNDGDPAIR